MKELGKSYSPKDNRKMSNFKRKKKQQSFLGFGVKIT